MLSHLGTDMSHQIGSRWIEQALTWCAREEGKRRDDRHVCEDRVIRNLGAVLDDGELALTPGEQETYVSVRVSGSEKPDRDR